MKFSTALTASATILSAALSASAHGYVQQLTIGGKTYGGWLPFDSPYTSPPTKSIVRKIRDDGPVTDVTDPAMACNFGGEAAAALTADVNAGDEVKITWNRWPDDHKGPITVWMASCGASCDSFDPSKGNVWFKTEQQSLTNGVWPTDKLIADDLTWTTTIPKGLKSNAYLLRMEILALHSAGAPQFYPSCAQLNVKNGGSEVPAKSDLVSLPGAYANAGNAIYGDIWEQPKTWPVAGPAIASFINGGSSEPASSEPVVASTSTKAAATSAKAGAASTSTVAASTVAPGNVGSKPTSSTPTATPVGPASSTSAPASTSTGKVCRLRPRPKDTKRALAPSAREVYEAAAKNLKALKPAEVVAPTFTGFRPMEAVPIAKRSWLSHGRARRAQNALGH